MPIIVVLAIAIVACPFVLVDCIKNSDSPMFRNFREELQESRKSKSRACTIYARIF